jgi:hypothetical protein
MTSVSSSAFPILYKKRKDGKFQVYSISVVEENGFPVILSSSWQDGMKDTSMITDRNVIYEGKNLDFRLTPNDSLIIKEGTKFFEINL